MEGEPGYGFQSLIGVYGFCGAEVTTKVTKKYGFQSLIGVYGFCGFRIEIRRECL
jgi:hypothetical protein